MKTLIYPILASFTILFFACGNPEQSHESTETEEHSDHDGHDHSAMESDASDVSIAPENSSVFFVNLIDGEIVTSPFKVKMGA